MRFGKNDAKAQIAPDGQRGYRTDPQPDAGNPETEEL
jgi:hypothetical protein